MSSMPLNISLSQLNDQQLRMLCGSMDEHLKLLEEHFEAKIGRAHV